MEIYLIKIQRHSYVSLSIIVLHNYLSKTNTASKCKDTNPVTPDDPVFPYNDKHVANLTLAQVKTLDCGSLRQDDYPVQEIYPGTKLATLDGKYNAVASILLK